MYCLMEMNEWMNEEMSVEVCGSVQKHFQIWTFN